MIPSTKVSIGRYALAQFDLNKNNPYSPLNQNLDCPNFPKNVFNIDLQQA